ncbi:MAG: xanthine dehydrogenase family protein molybdopterin-binding subunit [Nitrospinota bacterium]
METKLATERKSEGVGSSLLRVDARDKATGDLVYGADFSLPGMLVGRALRSPCPHARIVGIDVSAARKVRGVTSVLTGEDHPGLYGSSIRDRPTLAIDKVRFQGEAVAAVAAEDDDTAAEALERIEVEYDELPGAFDPERAASPDAPIVHEQMMDYTRDRASHPVAGTNICNHFKLRRGDTGRVFASAHRVFTDRFHTHPVQHAQMEVHAAVAQKVGSKATLWTHNDSPYRCRRDLADAFRLSMANLRVISLPAGGGFGGKGGLNAEPLALALAFHTRGRPVRAAFSREEVFTSTLLRHPTIVDIKTAVTRDGLLLGREIRIFWDTGAYAEKGPTISMNSGYSGAGPYRVPNVKIDSLCVYTNNPVAGAFRGYGIPQVTWASEGQMDIIAHELGIDPLELRMRNAVVEGDLSATGETLRSVGLRESLSAVAESIGWNAPKPPGRGRGIAAMHKGGATAYAASSAFLKVNEDGTVHVLSSSLEVGQGAHTVLTQIAAEELGVQPEDVCLVSPDTDLTPYDRSTTSSRTTFAMGLAVQRAAADAKAQLLQLGAEVLEAPVEDIEVKEDVVSVRGLPERSLPVGRLTFGAHGERPIVGRGEYHMEDATPLDPETGQGARPVPFWMYGAQAAEVEVDEETGQVRVLRLAAAHDVGRAINPKGCEQQLDGALAMGLSCSLIEEVVLDNGRFVNPNFLDYRICASLDVPPLTSRIVEAPHPDGPFGAKGIGEPALAPTAAAIANAVYDAVGIRLKNSAIHPEAVLAALKEATPGP